MDNVLRDKIASMQQCQLAAQDAERELTAAYSAAERVASEELEAYLDDLSAQGAKMVELPQDLTDLIVELWKEHQNQLESSRQQKSSMRVFLNRLLGRTDWFVVPPDTTLWPNDSHNTPVTLTVRRSLKHN